mmetsp:Transcript_65264/g.105483  ORF Transcript_65264/g.105483 Transcript_65264/m.105483 type:complete len:88 (-) Transcript_65264:19-282(-)
MGFLNSMLPPDELPEVEVSVKQEPNGPFLDDKDRPFEAFVNDELVHSRKRGDGAGQKGRIGLSSDALYALVRKARFAAMRLRPETPA